jgi:hypothetical protein
MTEVKYKPNHNGNTPEARLRARLNNSGDAKHAEVVTKHGEGARRTFHNIFHSGHFVDEATQPRTDYSDPYVRYVRHSSVNDRGDEGDEG